MKKGFTIVNSVSYEPYLDRIKGNEWLKEQHRQAYVRIFEIIEKKIKGEFDKQSNYPITLELYGTFPSWKLKITRCPFFYFPFLWVRLWLFIRKLKNREDWTVFDADDPTSNFREI